MYYLLCIEARVSLRKRMNIQGHKEKKSQQKEPQRGSKNYKK